MSHCGVPGFPPKNYRQTLYCRLPISVGVLVVKSVMLAYLPDNWHFFRFMKGAWCYVSLSTTRNKDFDNFNILKFFVTALTILTILTILTMIIQETCGLILMRRMRWLNVVNSASQIHWHPKLFGLTLDNSYHCLRYLRYLRYFVSRWITLIIVWDISQLDITQSIVWHISPEGNTWVQNINEAK